MEQAKATATAIDWRGDRPSWRQRLRTHIVNHGIRVMCGSSVQVSADYASDLPLLSGTARLILLKALGALGVKSFITTSGLGYDFLCHTGDLANFPFYDRRAYRAELELCSRWLDGEARPVVYDIGANDGFFSTHLAQMLAGSKPDIYAFEPTPTTHAKLVQSVARLSLNDAIHPVAAAVIDDRRPVRIGYSQRNSLLAQLRAPGWKPAAGESVAEAQGVTLDGFSASMQTLPKLIKLDAEGSEVAVLRGAQDLLARPDRPPILLEWNPNTLRDRGESVAALIGELSGYALYYVNDYCGQKVPFGHPIESPETIDRVCNLFAVPLTEHAAGRWTAVLQRCRQA